MKVEKTLRGRKVFTIGCPCSLICILPCNVNERLFQVLWGTNTKLDRLGVTKTDLHLIIEG